MSDISQATLKFTDDTAALCSPVAVLVALQNLSRSTLGVSVLGTWSLPRYIKERVEPRQIGVNLWLHPDIPADYWPRYREKFAANGLSVLALKARVASVPFTFAEAGKDARQTTIGCSGLCRTWASATGCIAFIATGHWFLFQLASRHCRPQTGHFWQPQARLLLVALSRW
jgi:hypothetical protein